MTTQMTRYVFIGVPSYDGRQGGWITTQILQFNDTKTRFDYSLEGSSALTYNFNALWRIVLNNRAYTHFIMWHEDIEPVDQDWIIKLLDLADQHEADILSVVSPIKSNAQETSTALARGKEFGDYQRVKIDDLENLPDVFGEPELSKLFGWDKGRRIILTNTGLMCVRMNRRTVLETMCFDVNNWIKRDKAGEFYHLFEPEDWKWARDAQDKGLKVLATKAIKLKHIGRMGYPNFKE